MPTLDDTALNDMERAIVKLALRPGLSEQQVSQLGALRNSIAVRRLRGTELTVSPEQRHQLQTLLGRLQSAVQARRSEVELQLKQLDEHDKRLTEMADRMRQATEATQASRRKSADRAP